MVWSSACTWLPYAGAPLMLHFFIDFVNVFAKFFLPGIGILSQSPIAVIFLFLDFLDVWKIKIHNYQQKYWTIMWFITMTIFNWRANLSKLQISREIITAVSNNIHYNNDGYLSGQYEPNPALWNPNGQDGAILPTRDYPLYPERKVSPKAIDKKSFGALGGGIEKYSNIHVPLMSQPLRPPSLIPARCWETGWETSFLVVMYASCIVPIKGQFGLLIFSYMMRWPKKRKKSPWRIDENEQTWRSEFRHNSTCVGLRSGLCVHLYLSVLQVV